MQSVLVGSVYGLSLLLALGLLYRYHTAWYWHGLSLVAALALGLLPIPAAYQPPDLAIGGMFLFLLVWGTGLPLFRSHHEHAHHTPHHA